MFFLLSSVFVTFDANSVTTVAGSLRMEKGKTGVNILYMSVRVESDLSFDFIVHIREKSHPLPDAFLFTP